MTSTQPNRLLHVIGEMGYGGAELLVRDLSIQMQRSAGEVGVAVIGRCDEGLVRQLENAGVTVFRLNASLTSPSVIPAINRIVRAHGYDWVHAHLFPALYVCALASIIAPRNVRWFYTEHSTKNSRRARQWLRPIERFMYGRYDRIAGVSAAAMESLSAWIPGLDGQVIENGIDLARFRDAKPVPRNSLDIGVGQRVVLMAGAFRPEKNHATMVRALSKLPSDYVLVLAGDGAERAVVTNLAKELHLEQRVRFLGVVRDIESLMRMADVYVLPSLFEGFGLSALEAVAAGVPVVYADVAGLADMLDGAGWPVDPLDPQAIADAVLQADSAGESAPQVVHGLRVAERYSLETTSRKHREFYLSL